MGKAYGGGGGGEKILQKKGMGGSPFQNIFSI
jgi:hypothetical protein